MKKRNREEDENKERGLARRDYYWNRFWPDDFMREMDRMIDAMWSPWRHRLFRPERPWREFPSGVKQPLVDVLETEDSVVVTAELPGIEKSSVDVQVTQDSIEIKGERKSEKTEEGEDYYRRERSYSSFYRELSLPAEVIPGDATATMNNGILEVTIPKVVQEQKKKKKKVEVK